MIATNSGRTACVAAIRAAGKPLTAGQIAEAVIASGIASGLKGKTPKATLTAQIITGARNGKVFTKVRDERPQTFGLTKDAPETPGDLVDALRSHVASVVEKEKSRSRKSASAPAPSSTASEQ